MRAVALVAWVTTLAMVAALIAELNREPDEHGPAAEPSCEVACPDDGAEVELLTQRIAELERDIDAAHARAAWLDVNQGVLFHRRNIGPRPPGMGPFPERPRPETCEGPR